MAGSLGKPVDGRDAVTDVATITLWVQVVAFNTHKQPSAALEEDLDPLWKTLETNVRKPKKLTKKQLKQNVEQRDAHLHDLYTVCGAGYHPQGWKKAVAADNRKMFGICADTVAVDLKMDYLEKVVDSESVASATACDTVAVAV